MAKLNLKTMKKSTKDHIITFAMVIVVYIIVQTMITTGNMSSLMQGLLVPMCTYSIVAIGLNLCVGYLGELSIGHAGFMCVGAFSGCSTDELGYLKMAANAMDTMKTCEVKGTMQADINFDALETFMTDVAKATGADMVATVGEFPDGRKTMQMDYDMNLDMDTMKYDMSFDEYL